MDKTIENQIKNYFESNKTLSKEELMVLLRKDFSSWSDNTLNAYLYNLKKDGLINNLSRGIYTIGKIETFSPKINPKLKKIAARIHKTYPFINYCVWDSSWLNDLMRHQPFKHFAIVEVEKIAAEQVFNDLNNNFPNVYINPDNTFFDRYISVLDNVVIVKNLNSEAPTLKLNELTIPTLEKILVDILIDDNLFAAQQGELDFIFKSAFDKYAINESKMKRYAARRNRETQLENIINISLAK
ncbi:MAG: hypothetical protein C0432_06070 [Candidatus Puniceispirillum sp.]|nr:hypothetical protein [Candidatus Puniceispirillum sp.]